MFICICHLVCVSVSFRRTLHGVRSGMEHLKPPEALILSVETNNAEAWRRWKMSWGPYKVSSGLDQKDENIQVASFKAIKESLVLAPVYI